MTHLDKLREELEENLELLRGCVVENDQQGISIQKKVIRMIEREIEELLLPDDNGMDYKALCNALRLTGY